ncbi:glycoside hydrolase family 65 protein [Acidaminobacter sp. JC074]|uniref:glycosyl hydrolase family 65 protein n=1 Tax=Acidaminobacter sp. JC074 TaxID=2530199 RepID=UPI001F106E19|nr:glycosyl hydrolase family 65 protein [Acidaminobacter sp. JC074]MCH4890136.1 glycoside hydrolase family 65 protein [Acidaminobacter sp. JC074]
MTTINQTFEKEHYKHFEGLMTQGNGYLSIRASFEEDYIEGQDDLYWRMPANVTVEKKRHTEGKFGTYIPLIVGNHPILREEMINLPYFLGMNFYVDGCKFHINHARNHHRKLDLKDGLITRYFDFKGIHIKTERYIHQVHKNLVVQKYEIQGDKDIEVESYIDYGVTTNGYNHFVETSYNLENGLHLNLLTDMNDEVEIVSRLSLDKTTSVSDPPYLMEKKLLHLKKDQKYVFYKYTLIRTSKDVNPCGIDFDFDKLYAEHQKAWQEKWDMADVVIEGDSNLQYALRVSIYHLLRSNNEHESRVAIDAKGAAGEAYFGHFFWDTEIYLLPFYLLTNPVAAKNLLMFRVNTLEAAKKNAKSYGYNGAKYPWESSVSGAEQCSNWQYADLEIHVGLDIAYAMINYLKATGDQECFNNHFLECIDEVLMYFMERLSYKDGEFHLKGVMGPDEYIHYSDNNAYTNKLLYEIMKFRIQYQSDTFSKKLLIYKDGLVIQDDYIIEQCDHFGDFDNLDFDLVWPDKSKPFGATISQEKNYRSKALKQADVLMLFFLYKDQYSKERMKDNLDYYLPLTTHDSSLSYIIHSIIMNWTCDERAYEYLEKAMAIDINYGAEDGIHIANCGGLYQGLVFGLCGMKVGANVTFDPKLPKNIRKVSFKYNHLGKKYQVDINHNGVNVNEIM